jgi:hypothetical protein
MVEIAHMGPAESIAGLLETGEALRQWSGRHASGANGIRAVPAHAEWKLRLATLL